MTAPQAIPKEALQGIGDPAGDEFPQCFSCGNLHVRSISMAEMLSLPKARIVNAHTFLIARRAWGYLQCSNCEDRQELASLPWWQRLWRRASKANRSRS